MADKSIAEIPEDDFLSLIGKLLEEADKKASILNPHRLKEIRFAYSAAKEMLMKDGMRLSYKLNEPLKSMGSVTLEGRVLKFDNPEWFARTAEFADFTEVYPLSNGDIRITFTFHGLTEPIE